MPYKILKLTKINLSPIHNPHVNINSSQTQEEMTVRNGAVADGDNLNLCIISLTTTEYNNKYRVCSYMYF